MTMMMIMMMTKMKMITMMMMMMGKMILTKYAGNNFLGKKTLWWYLSWRLMVSVLLLVSRWSLNCWCLGGLSIVFRVLVALWRCVRKSWRCSVMFWVMLMLSWCFCGVLAVFPWCCGGIEKIVFFGPILHTGAFTYRCTQKNYTYTLLHAETPNTNWPQDIAFWLQFWTMGTRFIWERFFRHKFSRNKLQFHFDLSWSTRVSCGDRSQRTGRIAISPQFVHDQHVFRARKVHCAPAQSHFDHSFCWSMRVSCGKGAPTELQSYIYFSVWRFTRVSRQRDAFCKDRFALRCCL